jgi:hypothetical protein
VNNDVRLDWTTMSKEKSLSTKRRCDTLSEQGNSVGAVVEATGIALTCQPANKADQDFALGASSGAGKALADPADYERVRGQVCNYCA